MGCKKLTYRSFTEIPIYRDYEPESFLKVVKGKKSEAKILRLEAFGSTKNLDVNYCPFGTEQGGRKGFVTTSRGKYGFQGQLLDDEVKGNGNSVNYEYRMHDPRIGRFFAIDPLAPKYPHNSPYAFSENDVIACVELEGLEKSAVNAAVYDYFSGLVSGIFLDPITTVGVQAGAGNTEKAKEDLKNVGAALLAPPPTDALKSGSALGTGDYYNFKYHGTIALLDIITAVVGEKVLPQANITGKRLPFWKRWGKYVTDKEYRIRKKVNNRELLKDQNYTIWQDEDATKYLNSVEGEAAYMTTPDGGIIILREGASRQAIVEEIIHHNQRLKFGEDYFLKNRNKLEIEAQDELLKIGKIEGWSKEAMDEIRRAKAEWEKKK